MRQTYGYDLSIIKGPEKFLCVEIGVKHLKIKSSMHYFGKNKTSRSVLCTFVTPNGIAMVQSAEIGVLLQTKPTILNHHWYKGANAKEYSYSTIGNY